MVYKLHPSISTFFNNFVNGAFEKHTPSDSWNQEVIGRNGDWKYHTSLIERGQSSFRTRVNGLSEADQVIIYCYYYMQMHCVSGYHVFRNAVNNHNVKFLRNLVFVDFRCGPLTAGISMAWYKLLHNKVEGGLQFDYIGVDRAKAMRSHAREAWNAAAGLIHSESTVTLIDRSHAQSQLLPLIEKFRRGRDLTICVNCSYYFGSTTLNVPYFVSLITNLVSECNADRVCLVFQNADNSYKNVKWEEFKVMTEDLLIPLYPDNYEQLQYEDVTGKRTQGSRHPIKLRHSVLLNRHWMDRLERQ